MIGDHKGVGKALNFVKALCGFFMVYVHGISLFALNVNWIDLSQVPISVKCFAAVKAILAGSLPAFAGFYLRSQVGPQIRYDRLSPKYILFGLRVFGFFVILEGLRLTLMTASLLYVFNWHALEFIGLSMVVTYLILAIDQRILIPFTFFLAFANEWLSTATERFVINLNALSESAFDGISWFWTTAFFVLTLSAAGLFTSLFKTSQKWKSVRWTMIVILAGVSSLAIYPFIRADHRNLLSFVNLPRSIFFANAIDDNFWPFVASYQTFALGYFLRSILYNYQFKKWFIPLTIFSIAAVAFYFVTYFPEIANATHVKMTFTKNLFIHPAGIATMPAIFYLTLMLSYFLLKKFPLKVFDQFSKRAGNILFIYVIHGAFLNLAVFLFLKIFGQQQQLSLNTTLWVVDAFVVAAYIATVMCIPVIYWFVPISMSQNRK